MLFETNKLDAFWSNGREQSTWCRIYAIIWNNVSCFLWKKKAIAVCVHVHVQSLFHLIVMQFGFSYKTSLEVDFLYYWISGTKRVHFRIIAPVQYAEWLLHEMEFWMSSILSGRFRLYFFFIVQFYRKCF